MANELWNKKYNQLEVPDEDVEIIKTWLKQQPHLPENMDNLLICKFLTRCTSLNQTKQFIDSYFTMRHYAPEIFKNRDPMSSEMKQLHSVMQMVMMPKSTKDDFHVCIYRVIDPDPVHFTFEQTLKYAVMMHDLRIATEPDSKGDIWIFDIEKASLSFIPRIILSILKKYMNYNQFAQPLKIFQTHMVNVSPVLDRLVNLVKPLLHPVGQRLIFTHRPNTTTLYDYVSRDVLPEELGGTSCTMAEAQEKCIKHIEAHRDFFLNADKWEMDDTKIPGGSAKPKMDEGTFKSLNFD